MFSHFDSVLTDRMIAADSLIKKVECLLTNVDSLTQDSLYSMIARLDNALVERCVTPHFKLTNNVCSNAKEQLTSLLFHIKHVFREIYTSWVSGVTGYTPMFAGCLSEIDNVISHEVQLKKVTSMTVSR